MVEEVLGEPQLPKNFSHQTAHSFREVYQELSEHPDTPPPGFLLLDLDFTIRDTLRHGMKGKFGELPQESLDAITDLQNRGWTIAVITNQPEKGHLVAQWLGSVRKYPHFPKALAERGIPIFGGGPFFFINQFKKDPKSIDRITQWVKDQSQYTPHARILCVGDKPSDEAFALRLHSSLSSGGYTGSFTMIKLPIMGLNFQNNPRLQLLAETMGNAIGVVTP